MINEGSLVPVNSGAMTFAVHGTSHRIILRRRNRILAVHPGLSPSRLFYASAAVHIIVPPHQTNVAIFSHETADMRNNDTLKHSYTNYTVRVKKSRLGVAALF